MCDVCVITLGVIHHLMPDANVPTRRRKRELSWWLVVVACLLINVNQKSANITGLDSNVVAFSARI
jgi:hypothetical protein